MISRSQITSVQQLKQGKFRKAEKAFVAEGPKIVGELIHSNWEIISLFATEDWQKENEPELGGITLPVITISQKELERISFLRSPKQVLAVTRIPEPRKDFNIPNDRPVLVLDGISDPGNLGTIIRSADWFGFPQVICSTDTVDIFNPKVIQATMGSFLRVDIRYTELGQWFTDHPKFPVIGTSATGKSIYETVVPAASFLVIGSESHGIRESVSRHVDEWVSIPATEGNTESLNAAIATSVILSEFRRKRLPV